MFEMKKQQYENKLLKLNEEINKSKPVPSFPKGASHFPKGIAFVGERGPDLIVLPKGSEVIPNDQIEESLKRPSKL